MQNQFYELCNTMSIICATRTSAAVIVCGIEKFPYPCWGDLSETICYQKLCERYIRMGEYSGVRYQTFPFRFTASAAIRAHPTMLVTPLGLSNVEMRENPNYV